MNESYCCRCYTAMPVAMLFAVTASRAARALVPVRVCLGHAIECRVWGLPWGQISVSFYPICELWTSYLTTLNLRVLNRNMEHKGVRLLITAHQGADTQWALTAAVVSKMTKWSHSGQSQNCMYELITDLMELIQTLPGFQSYLTVCYQLLKKNI